MEAVKRCLISGPIYGAHSRLSSNASIMQMLGRDCARKLFADPQYRALKAEVARARQVILRAAPVSLVNGVRYLVNAAGGVVKFEEKTPAGRLSHLLLGIEALMLRTVVCVHPDDVVLPMHDGWVSRRQLSLVDLEALILDRTGFHIGIEEELVAIPDGLSVRPTEKRLGPKYMVQLGNPGTLAQ
ncbi:MAG: hypothetical protein WCB10_15065 [Steroidobacteraceae bacterium]